MCSNTKALSIIEEKAMDKRALLDERRRRWMSDRQTSLFREETALETNREVSGIYLPHANQVPNGGGSRNATGGVVVGGGGGSAVPPAVLAHTEFFLNKLTDKLASHIREEVRKEIQNSNEFSGEDLAEKMDNYLQDELSTHTCKICFELMDSQMGKTPILLFPCGHTFCDICMNAHAQTQSKRLAASSTAAFMRSSTSSSLSALTRTTCPYCRTVVDSAAINQALKELIGQFAKQRKGVISKDFSQLQSSHRQAKDVDTDGYDNRYDGYSPSKNNSSSKRQNNPPQDHRLLAKYSGQLRSCEMRCTILTNELDDARRDQQSVQKKMKVLLDASSHLKREKTSVDERIRQLEEERELIDKHLAEQESKRQGLEEDRHQTESRIQLTEHTLSNLRTEMEKLKIFTTGLLENMH